MMSEAVFKLVVIEQVTQRVWYEVTGVVSVAEAVAAYQEGEGRATSRKHLSTDHSEIEEVYQEADNAVSMG